MLTRATPILPLLLLSVGSGALANDTDIPTCETTSGVAGTLFQEQFGTIRAPEGFASVSVSPEGGAGRGELMTLPDMIYGNQMLVFLAAQAKPGDRALVVFRDSNGGPMESCLVTFDVFDAARYDFSQIGVGSCDFGTTHGVITLAAGTTQIIDLPDEYRDGAAAPAHVLDQLPERGAEQVRLTGKAPGYATFAWTGANTEGGLEGLCPVHVRGGS